MEQSEINYLKTELVNDLVATTTVMEDLWRYHPENPDKKDVVSEYKVLEKIKLDIEQELENLKEQRIFMNMIDKDKVFDLFSEEMGNDSSLSIDNLMKDPLSKIGMFVKLIQNHEIFHKKLNQFLSKENPDYDIEHTKSASMFTVYNRAWFYIDQIDLNDKNHIDAILDFKKEPLLSILGKALQYFEDTEQYERCAKLLTLKKLKRNIQNNQDTRKTLRRFVIQVQEIKGDKKNRKNKATK